MTSFGLISPVSAHSSPQPCDNGRRGPGEAAHPRHPGPARVPGGQQEGRGAQYAVTQQEEGDRGLQPHHGGGPGGPLGGRPEDPLPLCQAQSGSGLRSGDE